MNGENEKLILSSTIEVNKHSTMSDSSKGRGRPIPDASNSKKNLKHIWYEIERALSLESKYKANLLVTNTDQQPDIVALPSRDGAVQILRCLKVWFDLPSIVFLTSVNILDRFLSKMVVRQKFLACVTISCLKIATEIHRFQIKTSNLVNISQSKCKVQDVERMSDIIRSKLELETLTEPVTAYNFLALFLRFFDTLAAQLDLKALSSRMLQKKVLVRRLEVVMSNSNCATESPSIIALGLIHTEIERFMEAEIPSKSPYYSVEMLKFITFMFGQLHKLCKIIPEEYTACYESMKYILREYDNHNRSPYSQSLRWKFSRSTINSPRPLEMFCTNLDTIHED